LYRFDSWQSYTGFDRSEAEMSIARNGSPMEDSEPAAASSSSALQRSGGGERPGFIDCASLVQEAPAGLTLSTPWVELRSDLQENVDFLTVNFDAAMRLCEWYGGGPIIKRKVVQLGLSQVDTIELHPQMIVLSRVAATEADGFQQTVRQVKNFSKAALLSEIAEKDKPTELIERAKLLPPAVVASSNAAAQAPAGSDEAARARVEGRIWKEHTPLYTRAAGCDAQGDLVWPVLHRHTAWLQTSDRGIST
jgi:hypothetical protein